MPGNNLDYQRWMEMESEFRRLVEQWAHFTALRLRTLTFSTGKPRLDRAAEYEALAQAACVSPEAVRDQLKIVLPGLTTFADIADELKECSSSFRDRPTLLKHATRVARKELIYGPKALHRVTDAISYEHVVDRFWPRQQRLVIDHAFYAIYIAWRPDSRIIIPDHNRELLRAMAIDEAFFRVITPRRFEELVAYLYECLGCRVELTKATRDFGADILAWHGGPLASETVIAVQVKRYAANNKVGLKSLFELHGAVAHYTADTGHLVTTSDFTQPARHFAQGQRLHLVNLEAFQAELRRLFL